MKLRRRVVVVGGGFGGLELARSLAREPVHVTLVDRSNHHLFQPLLYQVAMAGLAPAEIAVPIRSVLRRQSNARVLLAEVTGVNLDTRCVLSREAQPLEYDYLVLATGAENSYFGHDDWQAAAPGLKDLDDAVEIRRRVLLAFEAAEREPDPIRQRRYLTFVVIGGGATGVELAGAIAELATFVLGRDFRMINADATKVILIEAGERLLTAFTPQLSEHARQSLAGMGVEVRTGWSVTGIDAQGLSCAPSAALRAAQRPSAANDGTKGGSIGAAMEGAERIEAATVLWAAGVRASGLCRRIGLEVDRQGRARVEQDCSVPGRPEVFVIGDAAVFVPEGQEHPLPGVSPVALQQARFVAKQIANSIHDRPRTGFRYLDKGMMATIGRSRAVAQVGRLQLTGFIAWLAWLALHIFYLIGFRNRIMVMLDWTYAYFAYRRGSRLITGHRLHAGTPQRASIEHAPALPTAVLPSAQSPDAPKQSASLASP
jgi:NADH:ubiquinone reductase (H+-translocating)